MWISEKGYFSEDVIALIPIPLHGVHYVYNTYIVYVNNVSVAKEK